MGVSPSSKKFDLKNIVFLGLDVNVKFTGVGDFEYTPEMLIFDVLHINL